MGTVLVFISKKSLKLKFITTVTPVILWLPATYIFLSLYGRTTPQSFLIPSNFQGKFRIVYGEKCGVEPKNENGRRILAIPSNGILIIKPEFEAGIINYEYYLVEKNGNRKKANSISEYKERLKKLPAVLFAGSGSSGGLMPDSSFSSESPFAIHYSDFYIYNTDTTDIEDFKFSQRFDSLTDAIVEGCRRR
jgi:hypothetical protein